MNEQARAGMKSRGYEKAREPRTSEAASQGVEIRTSYTTSPRDRPSRSFHSTSPSRASRRISSAIALASPLGREASAARAAPPPPTGRHLTPGTTPGAAERSLREDPIGRRPEAVPASAHPTPPEPVQQGPPMEGLDAVLVFVVGAALGASAAGLAFFAI